jgi:hypothetical protein
MARLWFWAFLLGLPACGEMCAYPRARDAGPPARLGEPCRDHWDCAIGLACASDGTCQPPGDDYPADAAAWPDGADEPDAAVDAAPDAAADAAIDAGDDAAAN